MKMSLKNLALLFGLLTTFAAAVASVTNSASRITVLEEQTSTVTKNLRAHCDSVAGKDEIMQHDLDVLSKIIPPLRDQVNEIRLEQRVQKQLLQDIKERLTR